MDSDCSHDDIILPDTKQLCHKNVCICIFQLLGVSNEVKMQRTTCHYRNRLLMPENPTAFHKPSTPHQPPDLLLMVP